MEDFRRTFVRLCKDSGTEPQESVLTQLHEARGLAAGTGTATRLDLGGHSLSTDTCAVLGKALSHDTALTEVALSDCMLSEEGKRNRQWKQGRLHRDTPTEAFHSRSLLLKSHS